MREPDRAQAQLPELEEFEGLLDILPEGTRVHELARVQVDKKTSFPIKAVVMGSTDHSAPTFALVGGVHGLERIGTRVVLAYLNMVARFCQWDRLFRAGLEDTRIVCIPLVNPAGMYRGTRSNGAGVDLMRNSPARAEGPTVWPLGGQRASSLLPWYGGRDGAPMEPEAKALCDFVRREVFPARASIIIDVHSGYGLRDSLWFPYGRTKRPLPELPEVYAIKQLLDTTLPNHVYKIEPQSQSYLIDGDLWDYMYDEHRREHPSTVMIPFTLEMGSWIWVKKNPRQALSSLGVFNPIKPHRLQRTLRRHLPLLDLLRRATASPDSWHPLERARRKVLEDEAFHRWFRST